MTIGYVVMPVDVGAEDCRVFLDLEKAKADAKMLVDATGVQFYVLKLVPVELYKPK